MDELEPLIIRDHDIDHAGEIVRYKQVHRLARDGDAILVIFVDGTRLRFSTVRTFDDTEIHVAAENVNPRDAR